MHHLNDWVRGQ
jgi:hypothetical protein